MRLIGDPWTAHVDLPLEIFTTRMGEECPLDGTGMALDDRAVADRDEESDPIDRRVEFFFFDKEFGAAPLSSPPTGDSPPSKDDYLTWRKHLVEEKDAVAEPINSQAKLLPIKNAHFRTGSAVMLPEGEAPSQGDENSSSSSSSSGSEKKTALNSVGALAVALRYNEERPGHRILIGGHTDSVGSDKDNDQLSEKRAELVHAVLVGGSEGRSKFQDIANDTGKVSDWKQILKWAAAAFPAVEELVDEEENEGSNGASGDENAASDSSSDSDSEPEEGKLGTGFALADPGVIDDNAASGEAAVEAFQVAYNENYKFLGGTGTISEDGKVGKQTWGAIYDLYQYNMALELGEDFDGLKKLQGMVEFLPTKKPFVGFGESAPVDGTHDEDAEVAEDRRVEVLFFAQGQEPDVALLDEDPHVSDLYHRDAFVREEIVGDSAKAGAFVLRSFDFGYQVDFDIDLTAERSFFLRCRTKELPDILASYDRAGVSDQGLRFSSFVDIAAGRYELREQLEHADICICRTVHVKKKGVFVHGQSLPLQGEEVEVPEHEPGAAANGLPDLLAGLDPHEPICEQEGEFDLA